MGILLGYLCLLTHLSGHLAGMPVPFNTPQRASPWDVPFNTPQWASRWAVPFNTPQQASPRDVPFNTPQWASRWAVPFDTPQWTSRWDACAFWHTSVGISLGCAFWHTSCDKPQGRPSSKPPFMESFLQPLQAQVSEKLAVSQVTVFCCYSNSTSLVTDTRIRCFLL